MSEFIDEYFDIDVSYDNLYQAYSMAENYEAMIEMLQANTVSKDLLRDDLTFHLQEYKDLVQQHKAIKEFEGGYYNKSIHPKLANYIAHLSVYLQKI